MREDETSVSVTFELVKKFDEKLHLSGFCDESLVRNAIHALRRCLVVARVVVLVNTTKTTTTTTLYHGLKCRLGFWPEEELDLYLTSISRPSL